MRASLNHTRIFKQNYKGNWIYDVVGDSVSVSRHPLNSDLKIPKNASNQLLDHLNNAPNELSPAAIEDLSNKLHATEFSLAQEKFPEAHCRLIHSQNLTKLKLSRLHLLRYLEKPDAPLDRNRFPVDIVTLLTKFLNPTSFENLVHLEIDGGGLYFTGDWIPEIAQRLPMLQSLVIYNVPLDSTNFTSLCNMLSHLTYLDISATEITNLTGISKIANLETLVASDLEFQSAEDIEEVFELKNLRVLDISGTNLNSIKNVEHFWKCQKVLPKLEEVELSLNWGSPEMVRDILIRHPTLKSVGLIETLNNYSALDNIPNRPIIFHTETFEMCANTMACYALKGGHYCRKLSKILVAAAYHFGTDPANQTDESLMKFAFIYKIRKLFC
ncbi:hypothetical protein B9Z55_004390 [Caenorhabditis nigoni]|uniref:Zer-1-like leucine-rich repeats region domain-containing protein n=1 Tax=Caenorhabditis nigoni TaxID=1611254 RepID=A0A2G5UW59_9PELO|nr:hypothetical protein B9Z55_004390 [Caenorhabditis nigoni]